MIHMYTNGRYHDARRNNASTQMQAFNYGTAAFEGMKAVYDKGNHRWLLFRPYEHFARLKRSAAVIGIDLTESFDRFVEIVATLVRRNDFRSDIYIRPLVYRNAKGVGMSRPSGYGFSVFVQSMPAGPPNRYRCCMVSQRRPIDGSCSVKIAGNYVLSFLSHREAAERGFDIGIMCSNTGFVSEASVMNIFFAGDGILYTPSLASGPLDGITRRTVIELASSELGTTVREGKYRPDRLHSADEIFLTGTGSGINYVKQYERKRFANGRSELLVPQIRQLYVDAIHGRLARRSDWLLPLK